MLAPEGRRGTHQSLGRSGENEGEAGRLVHRLYGWPYHVRDPIQHGADRLADRENRSGDYRLTVCSGEYAYHGASWNAGAGCAGRGWGIRAWAAFRRRATGAERPGFHLAV